MIYKICTYILAIFIVAIAAVLIWINIWLKPISFDDPERKNNRLRMFNFIPHDSNMKYSDYIDYKKKLVTAAADQVPTGAPKENRVNAAIPQEIKPGGKRVSFNKESEESEKENKCNTTKIRNGALLIHGLTDTPFLMSDIGNYLSSYPNCFLVREILLPGHGTVPGNLLYVSYNDWIEESGYGINSFLPEIEDENIKNLYIVGFSTGGALALYHGLKSEKIKNNVKDHIKGLILLSPALEVKSHLASFANWYKFVDILKPGTERPWDDITEDKDYAKYESFPKNAGDQIYLLGKQELNDKNSFLNIPVLIAVSEVDNTVNSEAVCVFFKKKIEKEALDKSKLILYERNNEQSFFDYILARDFSSANNRLTDSCWKDDGNKKISRVRISTNDKDHIDIAHTSIPVSPENEHYGSSSNSNKDNYYNCVHYFSKENKFKLCSGEEKCEDTDSKCKEKIKYGEITKYNIEKFTLRRLTYNPYFEELTKEIREFVQETSSE